MAFYTPDAVKYSYPSFFGRTFPQGLPIEKYIERMDAAGVEKGMLPAARGEGPPRWKIPYELVKKCVDAHPNRFAGMAGVEPQLGMEAVRELEKAVRDYGFKAAHFYPHWHKMPPNDPRCYPIYEKCVELNVPILIQVCACHYSYIPGWVNRPINVEDAAMHFPELKIVMFHGGWPWREEAIMMTQRFPNVYMIASDMYPKSKWVNPWNPNTLLPNWGPELTDYVKSAGQDKMMFGTNFPVTDMKQYISELDELGITGKVKAKFLRENALKVYNL